MDPNLYINNLLIHSLKILNLLVIYLFNLSLKNILYFIIDIILLKYRLLIVYNQNQKNLFYKYIYFFNILHHFYNHYYLNYRKYFKHESEDFV